MSELQKDMSMCVWLLQPEVCVGVCDAAVFGIDLIQSKYWTRITSIDTHTNTFYALFNFWLFWFLWFFFLIIIILVLICINFIGVSKINTLILY